MWASLRQCSPPVRLLLIAGFFFNLAFYMLIPYLAWHMRENLLLSASLIGLLLGTRHIAQQGCFVFGGLLADRFGRKPLMFYGCLLRAISLVLLAISEQPAGLTIAILLTGFSAALFTPAAQAVFAEQAKRDGQAIFALASVFRSAGELAGPLLGLVLIQFNFSILCLAAAIPFAGFAIALLLQQETAPAKTQQSTPLFSELPSIFKHRPFMVFCVTMSGYFIVINQLSFLLPLTIEQAGGDTYWVGLLFFTSAAMGVCLQFGLSRWCEKRWPAARILEYGFWLMAAAFSLPLLSSTLVDWMYLTVLILSGLILTLGMLMCYPVIMQQVSLHSGIANTATYFGVFYAIAGAGMALGNSLIGMLADASAPHSIHSYAWWLLLVVASSVAIGVRLQAKHYDHTHAELSHA